MIDVHIHLTPPEIAKDRSAYLKAEPVLAPLYQDPKAKMIDTGDLLEMMDQEGLEKALVMGFPWTREDTAKRHNEWLLEQGAKYPNRLYPLAAFDLTAVWAVHHAEAMLDAGMFGLGELAVYDRGLGPRELDRLENLAGLCRERGKPLLVHVNESIGHFYPGKAPIEISQIMELVRRCQGVKLILAHFGGGLPLLASLKREVREALNLVRFDTAAMPYLYLPQALPMALMILGPEHFFLGTDYPLLKPSRYLKYFTEAGLDLEATEIILNRSARTFFGWS